jgi:hypothetical protein
LICATGGLAGGAQAFAQPLKPPPPLQQAVAVVKSGVIWFNDGSLLLRRFGAGSVSLGAFPTREQRAPQIVTSASAVAGLLGGEGFVGGIVPHRLAPIPPPKPISGGGCTGWQPEVRAPADFVVVNDDLVVAAQGECPEGGATRQPLFIRNLRGGRWHVLRWLTGRNSPILAAEGDVLAVGVQFSLTTMAVALIDVRDQRTTARFILPDGYLAFASRNRLLLSASPAQDFPLGPQVSLAGGGVITRSGGAGFPYHIVLYTTRGRRLVELGSAVEAPPVSHMHIIVEREGTLAVLSLAGGPRRALTGFNAPARELLTLAFRWPALAILQTTSAILPASEVTCEHEDYYGPASAPFLTILDLARDEPFLPPPPSSLLESSDLLSHCPPRQPIP